MVTVEDIEREVANSFSIRMAMNAAVKNLQAAEKDMGSDIIREIILGTRTLTHEEQKVANKRFGKHGLVMLNALRNLNDAQRQYLFKRMGYVWEK